MLPVAFDNQGGFGFDGAERRAASLRRRVSTTAVIRVRVTVMFPVGVFFFMFRFFFLKQKSHVVG